ncbi:MAG: hypothetical protein IPN76_34680 [Saprospiraceae bacterium]|nr:hypothetical protein [Saprospiraceae bacterium]
MPVATNVIALSTGKTPSGQAFMPGLHCVATSYSNSPNGNPLEQFDVIETSAWVVILAPGRNCWWAIYYNAIIGTFLGAPDPSRATSRQRTTCLVRWAEWMPGLDCRATGLQLRSNVNGELFNLNTAKLNGASVNMAALYGAIHYHAAALQQNRYLKLRMVKREAITLPRRQLLAWNNPIAMFNTVYANAGLDSALGPATPATVGRCCIDIRADDRRGGGTGCKPIKGAIHVHYTAANRTSREQ